MNRALIVGLLLGLAAFAQRPLPPAQPHGNWWLAASADKREGFLVGFYECGYMMRRPFAELQDNLVVDAVRDYFAGSVALRSRSVVQAIQDLESGWKETGGIKFSVAAPSDEYDGDVWAGGGGLAARKEGIVLGFLECQETEMGLRPTLSPRDLTSRLDALYGVSYDEQSLLQAKQDDEKLGPAILRFEGLKWPPPSDRRQQSETRPTSAGR